MRKSIYFVGFLVLVSCGSKPTTPVEPATTLSLATWFEVSSELDALQVFIDAYKAAHPTASVTIQAEPIDPALRNAKLRDTGFAWDIAMQTLPFVPPPPGLGTGDLSTDLGTLTELTPQFDTLVLPILRGTVRQRLSPGGGPLLAAPIDLVRLNALTYNLKLLSTPPKTLADYHQLCATYAASNKMGPKPLAISGTDPGALTLLFYGLVPASVVQRTGTGAQAKSDIQAALDLLVYYRDNDCFLKLNNTGGTAWDGGASWDEETAAMAQGKVMMAVDASWAQSYLVANGFVAGQDFAVGEPLGTTAAFVYTVEAIIVNKALADTGPAQNFLKTVLAPEHQLAFSAIHGSVPAVPVGDVSAIKDAGVRTAVELFNAASTANRLAEPEAIRRYLASLTGATNPITKIVDDAPGTVTDTGAIADDLIAKSCTKDAAMMCAPVAPAQW